MKLNSNIQIGVYPDDEFRRDFAAAMRKASVFRPDTKTDSSGVLPTESGQGDPIKHARDVRDEL